MCRHAWSRNPGVCGMSEGRGDGGGGEEVTEWYQLTFPFTLNSDRLKCYEHVCTGMLSTVHVCLSNMDHMEEGFRLDYCERSTLVFTVVCHLLGAFVKCSSLYGSQNT